MGAKNTNRLEHDVDKINALTRSARLHDVIDDIMEEEGGLGFSKIIKAGAFVSSIEVWDIDPALPNAKLRTKTDFTRSGVFVTSFVKSVYDNSGTLIATSSSTIQRNPNNTVKDVNVVFARI